MENSIVRYDYIVIAFLITTFDSESLSTEFVENIKNIFSLHYFLN